ncbi:MAG: hypothetical protein M0Z73_05405 [Betaproteobacteria bacterium]|nr:hypothetical protein [Betaproteobacteria bacterium]
MTASCSRFNGRVVRRASHHAANRLRTAPLASDASSAWRGRGPTRLWGNPTERRPSPAGSDTQIHSSPRISSCDAVTGAPMRALSEAARKYRYGSRHDGRTGSCGGSARSASACERASSYSKAGRVTGGNSLHVWADSVISPARSAAERRAIGSIRKKVTADAASSSKAMKNMTSSSAFCCVNVPRDDSLTPRRRAD